MSQADTINRTVLDGLLESVGGDREFLGELIQTYFDDSPQLLGMMRAALAVGNAEEFRHAAHSLKSNSASFGATTLSKMCKDLEDTAKAGRLDGAAERILEAEAEYARVRSALEAIVG